jgi:hypothetical protein
LERLKTKTGLYDPAILTAFDMVLGVEAKFDVMDVAVIDLEEGMVLAEDVTASSEEKRILAKGQELSNTLIMSIRSYHRIMVVNEPIRVMVPLKR